MGERNITKWIGIRPTDPPETIPVSVAPPPGLVHVSATDAQYQAGTKTVYVVPPGKTLFLFSVQAGVGAFGDHVQSYAAVRNTAHVIQYYLFRTYSYARVYFSINRFYSPAKEIPAGWDIILTCQTGVEAGIVIDGWVK